ncbi:MAG TPA: quinolinate synthase NadA [Planctomycetota bacterium]|jgi:quinolinate synthase|nr:quinolinate synthase NadA [Planctomycetota bacterium]
MARTAEETREIVEDILRLKKERKAVILAHNYQRGELQDIADFTGDSLGLTQQAAKTDAKVIVFCGVHFMAETAAVMNPDKLVLIPDREAGCSLAAMISAESLRRWKAEHPGAVVVSYINCTAEVKAESDYICTSTNAQKVIEAVPEGKDILFCPDQFLGTFLQQKTGRKMHIWPGYCHAHNKIKTERIVDLKREHPKAQFLMHPECGCLTSCMPLADKVVSTEGIVKAARESPAREFIVGTEVGILHRLRRENPEKEFYPAAEEAFCEFMKLNDLEKVLWSLEDLEYKVIVPEEIAKRARRAIERMLEISDPGAYVQKAGSSSPVD